MLKSSGTKAPGIKAIPSNTDDDDDKDGDKDGLSGGAIASIVIGVIVALILVVVIAVKCCAKEREPVPGPPPSFTAYNPPPQGYTAPKLVTRSPTVRGPATRLYYPVWT